MQHTPVKLRGTICFLNMRLFQEQVSMTTSRRTAMTSQYSFSQLTPRELSDYRYARIRDVAFDAIKSLWQRRKAEGMKQTDLAQLLDADPATISRNLRGPGNWTLRTISDLTAALRGEVELTVRAAEDLAPNRLNYDAYAGFDDTTKPRIRSVIDDALSTSDDTRPLLPVIGTANTAAKPRKISNKPSGGILEMGKRPWN